MKVLTSVQNKGECMVSEANGERSREAGVLTSGQIAGDGRLLAFVGGKLVVAAGTLNSAGASDENIAGFAYGNYNATVTGPLGVAQDIPCVYIARDAELKASNTVLHGVTGGGAAAATAAVKVALAAKHLILR